MNNVLDGTKQDAYDAVTQTVKPANYRKGKGLLGVFFAVFVILLIYCFTTIAKGRKAASERIQKRWLEAVNRPSIRDAEIRHGFEK